MVSHPSKGTQGVLGTSAVWTLLGEDLALAATVASWDKPKGKSQS